MVELTTIYDEKILIRLKDIRAIESKGMYTMIFFKKQHIPTEIVLERYYDIKYIFEKWLTKKKE